MKTQLTETKRDRQRINRAVGKTGSFMPLERAQSIARRKGLDESIVPHIRTSHQAGQPNL